MDSRRTSTTDGFQQSNFYSNRLSPVSSIPLQPSTFNSANRTSTMPTRPLQWTNSLRTPPVVDLPQCPPNSSSGRTSTMPFEFCNWSTFCRISHATEPLQRTVFRLASTSDKFQTDFSSNRTLVRFLQQKVSIRASTADDFRLQHQCLRHPTIVNPSATSKISKLLLDC